MCRSSMAGMVANPYHRVMTKEGSKMGAKFEGLGGVQNNVRRRLVRQLTPSIESRMNFRGGVGPRRNVRNADEEWIRKWGRNSREGGRGVANRLATFRTTTKHLSA
jgi:hypothetical protein